jgi:hypothetical protein
MALSVRVTNEYSEVGKMRTGIEKSRTHRKPDPVSHPSHISHDLTWNRKMAAASKSLLLTA